MTICLAAICNKGLNLVVASDSMITNRSLSIEFEHPTKKMTELSDKCIALTSGDALAHTELFDSVQVEIEKLKSPTLKNIILKIKKCYQEMREEKIIEYYLIPRGFDNFAKFYQSQRILNPEISQRIQFQIEEYNYGLEILIAGIEDEQAHIYEIFDPGTSKCFDSIGFHAIGSGVPHALNSLIARGCNQNTNLEECLIEIFEAKRMAEKAPGVGATLTNICILCPKKGITGFPKEEYGKLEQIYKKWLKGDSNWNTEMNSLLKNIGIIK
ncbi:hypothetical protein KAU19_07285 [Candidatus Parcubacteria bacterium]|nr:hypothetical protein [Candidatus Parcubacteria bacterium]